MYIMPISKKIKKKPKKQVTKKKAKPKRRQPTIVNKNVVNVNNGGGSGVSGAKIPITLTDRYDTTPMIERPENRTFLLIENQAKQIEMFKNDLIKQQNDNFLTLTEAVGNNLLQIRDDIQNQTDDVQELQTLANTYLPKPKPKENDAIFKESPKKAQDQIFKDGPKEVQDQIFDYNDIYPYPPNNDKVVYTENKLTEAQKNRFNLYNSSNVKGSIKQHKQPKLLPVPEEPDPEFEDVPDDEQEKIEKKKKKKKKKTEIKPEVKVNITPKQEGFPCTEAGCARTFKNQIGLYSHTKKHDRDGGK
jgi:hypothetical protein